MSLRESGKLLVMLNCDGIKYVDMKTYLKVFGYIRSYEKSLKSKIIPQSIYHICLKYIYIHYFFGVKSESIKLSGHNKQTMIVDKSFGRKAGGVWSTHCIYGKYMFDSISNMIIKYKIKIVASNRKYSTFNIGFASDHNAIDTNFAEQKTDSPWYSFDSWGLIRRYNKQPCYTQNLNSIYAKNDIVIMTLDLKRGSLCYEIGDRNDSKTIIENIERSSDLKYKLALSAWYNGDSLSILDLSVAK